jgi:hypothetical protein
MPLTLMPDAKSPLRRAEARPVSRTLDTSQHHDSRFGRPGSEHGVKSVQGQTDAQMRTH